VTANMSQPKQDDSKTESEVTAPEMSHPQEGDNISEAQNVTEVSQEKEERPKTPVEEYQSGKISKIIHMKILGIVLN